MARTELFSRKQSGGVFTIEDSGNSTGARFWVHSGTGTDAAGGGQNPDAPLATLDYAIGLCTANKNDIIYLMPGHAETKSASGALFTADIAGVRIVGLGRGADRPTLTFSHTGATSTVSANGVSIENVLWVTGIDSVTTFATISGADCAILNCEMRDTTDIEVVTDFTVTGDRFTFTGNHKNGYTGGNANVRVLGLNGVDRALIANNRFITKVTTAVVNFVTTACTAVVIRDNTFLVTSTTDGSKNVVDTITGSTWAMYNAFDLGAGANYSGGSGAAVASDDVSAVSSSVVSAATAASTANSSALSATVSHGTATSTAHSSSLSAVVSHGTATSTAHSSSLSAVVSHGTATSTANSSALSATVSVGNGTDISTVQSVLTSIVQSVGTSVVTLCSNA